MELMNSDLSKLSYKAIKEEVDKIEIEKNYATAEYIKLAEA